MASRPVSIRRKERTMTIGIDIDDTLVDTFEHLLPMTAQFTGRSVEYLEENDISYDNTPDEWGMDMEEFAHRYFDEFVPTTPPKKGAARTVERLRSAGNRVVIITSRTNKYYKDCYYTTRIELENCNIEFDKLVCNPDKAQVCRDEGVEVMIDDHISNCEAASSVGARALLFTSRENQYQQSPFKRVHDWDDALIALERLGVPIV